ncbi:hypothetical protein Tco_0116856 [Tanacetum coccineum]
MKPADLRRKIQTLQMKGDEKGSSKERSTIRRRTKHPKLNDSDSFVDIVTNRTDDSQRSNSRIQQRSKQSRDSYSDDSFSRHNTTNMRATSPLDYDTNDSNDSWVSREKSKFKRRRRSHEISDDLDSSNTFKSYPPSPSMEDSRRTSGRKSDDSDCSDTSKRSLSPAPFDNTKKRSLQKSDDSNSNDTSKSYPSSPSRIM